VRRRLLPVRAATDLVHHATILVLIAENRRRRVALDRRKKGPVRL